MVGSIHKNWTIEYNILLDLPMKKVIFITGLTRMYNGFVCISGIDLQTGEFVRPIIHYPERPGIKKEFLFDGRKLLIKPLVKIEFDFLKAEPKSEFHTEDWAINPSVKPKLVSIPGDQEKKEILHKHLDQSLDNALYGQNRSLIIVKPQQIPFISLSLQEDRLRTHLTFKDLSGGLQRNLPVTDANWLGIARWLWKKHRGNKKHTALNLRFFLENKDIYLRIGMTREFQGQKWKQVSGIFSFPDWLAGHSFVDYNYDFDDHV
jgi:hypothetical protein